MAKNKKAKAKTSGKVGYGKPPVAHQFKPGQSGNPNGRPKVIPDISETAANELKRRRKLVIDGKETTLRTDEFLIRKLVALAASGKLSALAQLLALAAPHMEKEKVRVLRYKKITRDMSVKDAADAYEKMVREIDNEYGDAEMIIRRDDSWKS